MAKTRTIAKLGMIAGLMLTACAGFAFYDTDILIQRALNSPDFTVKYSGVSASMVELRVNGESIGTQTVSPSKTAGECKFTLDLLSLNDGDNAVEVRLFDRNGKLVGTQKMNVLAGDSEPSPVRLTGTKMGSTIQGGLEIKVGFGREMRNAYVSFFVDEQFKSMTNVAPYTYHWDTLGELNGWHEIQAWVVDETSTTFKTRKIRVYVNNPGGRTNRQNPTEVTAATNIASTTAQSVKATTAPVKSVANTANATKAVKASSAQVKNVATAVKTATTARLPIDLTPAVDGIKMVTSNAVGFQTGQNSKPVTANAKLMTPKPIPTKLEGVAKTNVADVRNTMAAASTIAVTKGTKLPNIGNFSIVMNSKVVKFDVQPRVKDGVALTPIRHLLEANGNKVDWENLTKTLFGEANGKKIVVKIGDKMATVGELQVELEAMPFLEKGRTIVPLSFIRDSLQVDVEFDRKTGHVLITSVKERK